MMMASLTLTLAAVAVFGGGGGSELAKSLGEAASKPVAIECGSNQTFKSFEFDPADDNELTRIIFRVAKLRRAPGVEHAYHWPGLPSWHFSLEAVQQLAQDRQRAANVSEAYESTIREGKVTLKTKPGRPLQISSLESWPFAKQVKVDPFFTQIGLAT
ncbi:MAG TPA: hypothetical protein PLX06_00580, partial [Fimbriimonadaceae bacterium]|nr:hypothetical protein [Fimbriimonadaceae bacterium]